jgi:adenine-specific DNA-methyltransferase
VAAVTFSLTPALSRTREREEMDAARDIPDALTPTLSRNREREDADAARGISDAPGQPVETGVTYPLSRVRERVGVRADVQAKARELRARTTEAETLLWHHLRGRRFQNFKFRRQRALGPYILDFICLEAGLVIEIDGGQHVEQQAYDQARTVLIETQGLTVIRFWNHEVMNETAAVLERIWQALQTLTPTLSRNRERE